MNGCERRMGQSLIVRLSRNTLFPFPLSGRTGGAARSTSRGWMVGTIA